MKKHIYLIGFMGTGKSTVSKELQKITGWRELDLDTYIEDKHGETISDIFAEKGESYFRDLESVCLQDTAREKATQIVSCGGGTVLRQENVALMQDTGTIILLTATPETVYQRVRHSTERPILNGNMTVEYIAALMERRKDHYHAAAEMVIDTDGMTPEDIAEIIAKIL